VRPHLFEMLPEFCKRSDVGIGVDRLPWRHRIHKNHSLAVPEDCDQTVIIILPSDRYFLNFLFPGDWGWCHSMDCLVSGSQWWTQISSDVTIWDRKASPSASKHANSEEMSFLSVLCSTVRLWETHLVHTFKYPRSRMMWLTLPLLIERLSASCQVVMCQSSRQHAADLDYQLKGMAWVRQIMELCFSCSGSSHFSHPAAKCASVEHSTSINIAKIFVVVSYWRLATRNSVTACLYHTSLTVSTVRHCCRSAICQKSLWLPT